MMRSLPFLRRSLAFLLLATMVAAPTAQADSGPDLPALVQSCAGERDPESCMAQAVALVNSLCTHGAIGCIVCIDFTPMDDIDTDLTQIVQLSPFGEYLVRWYGFSRGSSHDPFMPGMYGLKWSMSDEIMCSADSESS